MEEFADGIRQDNFSDLKISNDSTSLVKFQSPAGRGNLFGNDMGVDFFTIRCLADILAFDFRENLPLAEMGLDRIPIAVANMAMAVSRALRTICGQKKVILGSSFENITLVQIDWWWLTLPVAVEILGIAFFTLLCVHNMRSKTNLWKSSLVAALYHSVDLDQQQKGKPIEGLHDMEQLADGMKVKLMASTKDDDNWTRLIEQ
jgi:hypothetical protein